MTRQIVWEEGSRKLREWRMHRFHGGGGDGFLEILQERIVCCRSDLRANHPEKKDLLHTVNEKLTKYRKTNRERLG